MASDLRWNNSCKCSRRLYRDSSWSRKFHVCDESLLADLGRITGAQPIEVSWEHSEAKQGSEIAVYKRFETTMQLVRHLSTFAPISGVSLAAAGVRRENYVSGQHRFTD